MVWACVRTKNSPVKMVLNFEVREHKKKVKNCLKKSRLKEENASKCTKWRKYVWTFRNGMITAIPLMEIPPD